MKLITKKQEEEMEEKMIKKLMFAILNPILGVDAEEAKIRAENLYYADDVIIIKK